jgi:type II secretion system protein C
MASKRTSKKSISKIPPKTAERIVAVSLQHPELGARRLALLLKKKRISVSAAAIQSILRREDLQNREKRLAKLKKQAQKPKSTPKKPSAKITDKAAGRIVEVALENPELGARRLTPLLKKKRISVSAAAIQSILRREGLQTREKRLAKIKKHAQKAQKPKSPPKKSATQITDEVAERIVAISLQNPDFGVRRLLPLLKKERIRIPASTVYKVMRRHGLQSRAARAARLEKRAKAARKPKSPPRKPAAPITDEVAERICELSLQNPDLGAKRLVPLLKKQGILASSSVVYRILKRRELQTREKRLAKAAETTAQPVVIPKTFPEKIPPEVEERIVALSLQNPECGARRLRPLLQQEEILISASAVYKILKRNSLENRQKRLLKLEARQAPEIPPAPGLEAPEPFAEPFESEPFTSVDEVPEPVPEQLKIELPPDADEVPAPILGPAAAEPISPEAETHVPAEAPEPVPEPAATAPAEPERPPVRKAPVKPVRKRSHWVFYPLYLLLFILIGYLGFQAVQTIQYARLESEDLNIGDSVPGGMAANTDAPGGSLDGYRQIWQRDLFNISKPKNAGAQEKISLDKLALAKKDLGLELMGTVVADNPRLSRAIIDNRSIRKQEAYREGDTAGKVKIKKILRNNVVITTAKGDELLTVEIKETGKSAPSALTQRVGSQSSSAQPATGTRQQRARTSAISLKQDEIESSLADLDKLMEQMKISPYKTGDQASGFRLGNVARDSVLRKMGLRSRDVIVGIDDETITGPEQAADFFQRLAGGGEVTIKLKRRRRTRQIKLNIE